MRPLCFRLAQLLLLSLTLAALVLERAWAQDAAYPYAPPWFGPYALPVPSIGGALVARTTEVMPQWRGLLSGGQRSQSLHIDLEVPLLPEVVSVRGWGCVREFYRLSPAEALRMGVDEARSTGSEGGDYYLQTRIRLLGETALRPNIILDLTLKTAAATTAASRRFYDTPGYYFSVELGKDWMPQSADTPNALCLRTALQLGFLCWETGQTSRQNDAYLYGLEVSAAWRGLQLRTEVSGYTGWMQGHPHYRVDYGDRPLTLRASLGYRLRSSLTLTADLEHGLRDYPYTLLGLGLRVALPSLTPRLAPH